MRVHVDQYDVSGGDTIRVPASDRATADRCRLKVNKGIVFTIRETWVPQSSGGSRENGGMYSRSDSLIDNQVYQSVPNEFSKIVV